ncbi:glycosyltransferase [Paenibacillus rhizophilus]|uniref:Glycosyltransferase n=1 Tax=Paenibacillus rhizophilus TaxID=1850366 RepID=A0A3N9PY81_9BACL|nr:glycosyltransferase [Paenibacillus rhizophilus]
MKSIFFIFLRIFGVKSKLELIPLNDLKKDGDRWVSYGADPSFLIHGEFGVGWNEMSWSSNSEERIPLKMYWDNGEDFNEGRSLIIGEISKGNSNTKTYLYIPDDAIAIRLDPGEKKLDFSFSNLKVKKVSRICVAVKALRNYSFQRGYGYRGIVSLIRKVLNAIKTSGIKSLWANAKQIMEYNSNSLVNDYSSWLENSIILEKEISQINDEIEAFEYKPLISIILPVYNIEEVWLRKCIDSVLAQYYSNWELCISDDASTKLHIAKVLENYKARDSRIKVVYRSENGHISKSSNSALAIATGEFIALLDHDDELTPDALYENVLLLNRFRDADIIYSDEDKISIEGERFSPFFKPDWSPDLLLSQMYICHLTVCRKCLIDQVEGFREGYEGSQDFDLMLRVTELTDNIYHIPKILYHWRAIQNSTASSGSSKDYTHIAGLKAVEDALARRKLPATVVSVEGHSNIYLTRFRPTSNPKISIIIPTKNMASVLKTCLDSIFTKTKYFNYEVIIIDNGSTEPEIFKLYKYWEKNEKERFKVYVLDIPFNYSKLNNFGAEKASGDLLLLLNNDTEVISEDWLQEMAGQAIRPEIGAVGACLYYPDKTLQHGGVVLGLGGVAGHSHKHFASDSSGYYRRLKIVSNYTAVTAACLMIRKEIFFEVNGLEEELQVAFNDVDFCLKVWSLGYNNLWLPHVKLYHYESKSRGYEDTPEKQLRFAGEIEWVKNRWSKILNNDPAYNPNLSKDREDFSIGIPSEIYENNLNIMRCKKENVHSNKVNI